MTRLLIGTYESLMIYDVDDETYNIVHEGSGPYYGITWDEKNLYAVIRFYFPPEEDKNMKNAIGIFDKGSLDLLDVLPRRMLSNAHQIEYRQGKLYITNTHYCTMLVWDGVFREYDIIRYPNIKGHVHNNSIWGDGTKYYVVNAKPRKVYIYEETDDMQFGLTREYVDFHKGGLLHNIYVENDRFYTLDSGEGELISKKIKDKAPKVHFKVGREHTFLRGLARTPDRWYIGNSLFRKREERGKDRETDLYILDNEYNLLQTKSIERSGGQIYEVRAIDEPDLAHNGIPFA